jgi:hypothetical protein
MGLSFTIAAGPRQRSHSPVRVQWDSWPYLLSQIRHSPNLEEPGPHIYIPQKQGGPVIRPGNRFPFRRLLRLAGIRWRYSNPPPCSEPYITTDGQSANLSWNKAPIWGLRPNFYYSQTVCWCGALALTRGRVCRLKLLLALASAVIFGSESRGTRKHILLSQIRDFPFRRILRLAWLRWRYSTPLPHGISPNSLLRLTSTSPFTTSGEPDRNHRLQRS